MGLIINNFVLIYPFLYFTGLFGFTILGLLLIPFYYIRVPENSFHWLTADYERRIENTPNAVHQMGNNHIIIYATVGMLSV